MTESATPPPDGDAHLRTQVLESFLRRYFEDQDHGGVKGIEDYLAAWPEHRDVIEEGFRLMHGESVGSADTEGAPNATARPIERLGPYAIRGELGRGGQGRVLLGIDSRVDRRVAIKVLDLPPGPAHRPRLERFQREAEVLARLSHPGICPVWEVEVDGPQPYLVMPLLEGETLARHVRSGDRLPLRRVLEIGEDVARALDAAHEEGIVHRDVKPENVMLTPSGSPVIMDFGLARDVRSEQPTLTMTGDVLGTLPYMSPEQLREGVKALDRRTDVYSLGVMLFECATGRLPFVAPTQEQLLRAILRDPLPDARKIEPALPRDLVVVLETALDRDPGRRLRSCGELADELRRVRERRPIRSRPAGPWLRFRRWAERNPTLAATSVASFVLLLAGLVTALALLRRVDEQRRDKELALGEKARALADVTRLSDLTVLDELKQRWTALQPPLPDRRRAMEGWLAQAHELLDRREIHRATLQRLRDERALPYDEEARRRNREGHPAAKVVDRFQKLERAITLERDRLMSRPPTDAREDRLDEIEEQLEQIDAHIAVETGALDKRLRWEFASASDRWHEKQLATLVDRLEDLKDDDVHAPTIAGVRSLLAKADELADSMTRDEPAWRACAREIADEAGSPRYRGLELAPQVGLVPLGRDPLSGLFEFAHLLSGRPARRDPSTGRLEITPETGIVLVLLPPATARLGARAPREGEPTVGPHFDTMAAFWERPVHEVELDAFFMSKFEMTQAQWERAAGKNPSRFAPGPGFFGRPITLLHPVETVGRDESANLLARIDLTLPTSTQWEYATRAGTSSRFWTGNDIASLQGAANVADRSWGEAGLANSARWNREIDDGWPSHAPIGQYRANAFGLHDVHGNIREWVRDPWGPYAIEARKGDGLRDVGDEGFGVSRGGSYDHSARFARSSARQQTSVTLRFEALGVRPARAIDE